MSHPDPCYDPDNSYEDDMNYDDYNDFHYGEVEADDLEDCWEEDYDDSMDGDFDSAMRDAGFGTDEDYGFFGGDYE